MERHVRCGAKAQRWRWVLRDAEGSEKEGGANGSVGGGGRAVSGVGGRHGAGRRHGGRGLRAARGRGVAVVGGDCGRRGGTSPRWAGTAGGGIMAYVLRSLWAQPFRKELPRVLRGGRASGDLGTRAEHGDSGRTRVSQAPAAFQFYFTRRELGARVVFVDPAGTVGCKLGGAEAESH